MIKEIHLGDSTPLPFLAKALEASPTRVIEIGFHTLGLLLTIADVLPFDRAKAIAEELGYIVRRKDAS
jgi:hypothetical protein